MSTTASISLSSDITGDNLSLSSRATLNKAGSNSTNLDQFTGINTIQYATTQSAITLIAEADYVDTNVAHKIYIRNASKSTSCFVLVDVDSTSNEPMGRLYYNDWCFFPWMGTKDIDITTNEVGMTVEFAVISQSVAST
tara:strand:+ start:1087 stop:1503 length:417 start_codon:yes stop_codon:yes gene_type:complete